VEAKPSRISPVPAGARFKLAERKLELSLPNSVSDKGIADVVALAEIDASLLPASAVSADLSARVVLAAGVGVLLCGNAVVAITGCFG
jgi:hypothetical protein